MGTEDSWLDTHGKPIREHHAALSDYTWMDLTPIDKWGGKGASLAFRYRDPVTGDWSDTGSVDLSPGALGRLVSTLNNFLLSFGADYLRMRVCLKDGCMLNTGLDEAIIREYSGDNHTRRIRISRGMMVGDDLSGREAALIADLDCEEVFRLGEELNSLVKGYWLPFGFDPSEWALGFSLAAESKSDRHLAAIEVILEAMHDALESGDIASLETLAKTALKQVERTRPGYYSGDPELGGRGSVRHVIDVFQNFDWPQAYDLIKSEASRRDADGGIDVFLGMCLDLVDRLQDVFGRAIKVSYEKREETAEKVAKVIRGECSEHISARLDIPRQAVADGEWAYRWDLERLARRVLRELALTAPVVDNLFRSTRGK